MKIQTFSFMKMHLQISPVEWWPCCPGWWGWGWGALLCNSVEATYLLYKWKRVLHNKHITDALIMNEAFRLNRRTSALEILQSCIKTSFFLWMVFFCWKWGGYEGFGVMYSSGFDNTIYMHDEFVFILYLFRYSKCKRRTIDTQGRFQYQTNRQTILSW